MYVLVDLSSGAPIYFPEYTHVLAASVCHLCLVLTVLSPFTPRRYPTPTYPPKSYASESYSTDTSWFVKAAVTGTRIAMGTWMQITCLLIATLQLNSV